MSESLQNFFMYVGIFTTGVFGFLLFCTVAFFSLLLEDQWRVHRKARYAQHQKAKLTSVPSQEVIENFFPMESDDIRAERQSQEAIEVLRARLQRNDETVVAAAGWETEGATVSYPAFNMKGEVIESRGAHKA